MNTNLVRLSSDELSQASIAQQQISQKEFEIKLVNINSLHLSSQDANNLYYYNQQRKQSFLTEISNLKVQRDNHINAALMYALTLAESELAQHSTYSSASVLISNIRSFLTIQNIRLVVSLPVMVKISLLNSRLQRSGGHASLRRELTNLKMQLQIQ